MHLQPLVTIMQFNILLVCLALLASLAPAMAVKAGEQMVRRAIYPTLELISSTNYENL